MKKRWLLILIIIITITITLAFVHYTNSMVTEEREETEKSEWKWEIDNSNENNAKIDINGSQLVPERILSRCKHPSVGEEATSVALLKVHKTGSTTLSSILYRFGIHRRLSFVMMKGETHQFYPQTIGEAYKSFYPPCQQKKYDILNIHSRYNGRSILTKYMQENTYVIATLRNPLEQMLSGFNYYGFAKQVKKMGKTYSDFLDNPKPYLRPLSSLLPNPINLIWNSMSYDIGLSEFNIPVGIKKKQIESNPRYVSEVERFLEWAEEQIDFFVLAEYFDESLILLKDRLHWEIEDIVYFSQNAAADTLDQDIDEMLLNKTIEFSYIDYLLYHRMKQKLDELKQEKGDRLAVEVKTLQSLNNNFAHYCLAKSEVDPKLYGEVKILSNKLRKERRHDRCCFEAAIDEQKYVKDIKIYMANGCKMQGT